MATIKKKKSFRIFFLLKTPQQAEFWVPDRVSCEVETGNSDRQVKQNLLDVFRSLSRQTNLRMQDSGQGGPAEF